MCARKNKFNWLMWAFTCCGNFTSILIILLTLSGCGNQTNVSKKLSEFDQNPSHYLNPNEPGLDISPAQQTALAQDYLARYFSPWDAAEGSKKKMAGVLAQYRMIFAGYKKHPGWGLNYKPLTTDFMQTLADNANLAAFPNINQPGMIVNRSFVRSLPTKLPSFGNPQQAGEGFPFDNLQESYVAKGSPVRILHESKDKLWYLVLLSSFSGWVPSQDVGLVSPQFITQWKSWPFLIATKDNIPLTAANNLAPALMRVGVLYPSVPSTNPQQYEVLLPFLDSKGNAQINQMFVDKTAAVQPFPLPLSAANVAAVTQSFIGTPYGWGGLYDQRDCSATTQDLFTSFGIWLPRNSGMQTSRGEVISIAGLSREQKFKIIEQRGIPYFTLIQAPGHIVLYIGMHNNVPYVLQDVWGLKTVNLLGKAGRIVIGKTVITPLDFGQEYLNVRSFVDKTVKVIILKPEKLLKAKSS